MIATWRAMRPEDLATVAALAERIHANHPERPDVFAERLALHPTGCLALQGGEGLEGYAIAHPWARRPPKLDALLGATPRRPEYFYLHDVALLPGARGAGAARAAVARLAEEARRLKLDEMRLIAVSGSAAAWARLGFVAYGAPCPPSYGPDARAMRRLAQDAPALRP
ncbi:MAG: GNAT family N-acetyltransferase [Rhodoblastus sp.]|nr:MAG: GNAT family N-acetyltransferase [Rhodoblastus sp.]